MLSTWQSGKKFDNLSKIWYAAIFINYIDFQCEMSRDSVINTEDYNI